MLVRVLGSAAGGGLPQWNCNCRICALARAGNGRVSARTQSSAAVSSDGKRWVVLNASPDLRQQINDNPPLHPANGSRHSPIHAAVLTNADVDHVAGLLTMRERQPFAIYATTRVLAVLAANPIFAVLDQSLVPRRELPLEREVALCGADGTPLGLQAQAFAVAGKVALYLEDPSKGPGFGTQAGDTIGLAIRETGKPERFCYVPGCAAVDERLVQRLGGAELVLFDGTLFHDDEMLAGGTGAKTGRRMGHISIDGPVGSLVALSGVALGRRVFTHINNTNPILIEDSPERAAVEAAGWQVAHDGQEFQV